MRSSGCFLALILAASACGSDPAAAPPGTATSSGGGEGGSSTTSGPIDLVRDARGVPHVFAETIPDAFYGLGWAMAEDRLFQMDFSRRYARGTMSAAFGRGPGDKNLQHDVRMRTMGWARHAELVASSLPTDVREPLESFAAGVNAFVHGEGFELPPAFATAGIDAFEDWTIADSLLAWDKVTDHFGGDPQNELQKMLDCPGGCPVDPACNPGIDESAAVVPDPTQASWHAPYGDRALEPKLKASHAWVVSGARTTTGKPVLHSDPQLAVTAPSFWYEFHLSAGDLDARGISVAGVPGHLVGWNRHVARGATSAGGDPLDLYQLTLGPAGSTYVLDGEEKAFDEVEESVEIAGESPHVFTVRSTVWGPVVTDLLEAVPSGMQFAAQHVVLKEKSTHSVAGLIRMMLASDLATYQEALVDYASPLIHGLYADDQGHIAYHMLGAMPGREVGDNPHPGQYPYDGSKSASAWKPNLTAEQRPHVIDPPQGYLFSANHLAVGSWYTTYTGSVGVGDSERSLRLRTIFESALGAPDDKMSPADVLAIHGDSVPEAVVRFRDLLAFLVESGQTDADPADPPALAAAKTKCRAASQALALWSGEAKGSDPITPVATWLAGEMPFLFRLLKNPELVCAFGGGEGGLSRWLKEATAEPASLLTPGSPSSKFIIETAAGAWDAVSADLGPDPKLWAPTNQRFMVDYQNNKYCPVAAQGSCALDEQQSFDVELEVQLVHTILSQSGNSYSHFVDFSDLQGSKAILPPGISEDPASPLFDNAVETWTKAALDPAPLDRKLVEADALSTKTLTEP